MSMTKAELMELVGKAVKVTFKDGQTSIGILGYTSQYCAEEGYRRPNYFTINDWDFKVLHIKKCEEIPTWWW